MKNQRLRKNSFVLVLFMVLLSARFCLAQDTATNTDKENALKQEIESAKDPVLVEPQIDELVSLYIKESNFSDAYNFIDSLKGSKAFSKSPVVYYYKALLRYLQMKFFEDNNDWGDLYENKDAFTKDLNTALEKANKLNAKELNSTSLKIKLLEWHLQEDKEAAKPALDELYDLAQQYADKKENMDVVRSIADELSETGENTYAKRLYMLYVSEISDSAVAYEELKKLADEFLAQGKSDLATSLYSAYVDKLDKSDKDVNIKIEDMVKLAKQFEDSGWQEPLDPLFAEDIYRRIETQYKPESFNADMGYQRSYNLERINKDESCVLEYLKLVNNFSDYAEKDRIYFRLGVITAYVFSDIVKAREYFSKVIAEYPESLDYYNSLYHLGLLDQWEKKFDQAKESYNKIIEGTKNLASEIDLVAMAKQRLDELEKQHDIEYNLKTFLDAVLILDKAKNNKYMQLNLRAKEDKSYLEQNVNYKVSSYFADTGCLQPNVTYLWSGQLGSNQNPLNEYQFDTDYRDSTGTKVVNVVLVAESGVVGATLELENIYQKQ